MNTYQRVFDAQKQYFSSDITKSYEWRIQQLNKLEKLLTENKEAFYKSLGRDFKTCYFEQAFEILGLLGTIAHTKDQGSHTVSRLSSALLTLL